MLGNNQVPLVKNHFKFAVPYPKIAKNHSSIAAGIIYPTLQLITPLRIIPDLGWGALPAAVANATVREPGQRNFLGQESR